MVPHMSYYDIVVLPSSLVDDEHYCAVTGGDGRVENGVANEVPITSDLLFELELMTLLTETNVLNKCKKNVLSVTTRLPMMPTKTPSARGDDGGELLDGRMRGNWLMGRRGRQG
ncbi:hypothetical protein PIB30_017259 [Stylosanthes scabra]|uniref:Uncharacterized protein n=1 Tax=Stylosanthes scabra TaxID=79078 RepID=A0ABU6Q7D7_9FABA|nr:hypothetical protein [Stylosanthes scabra]